MAVDPFLTVSAVEYVMSFDEQRELRIRIVYDVEHLCRSRDFVVLVVIHFLAIHLFPLTRVIRRPDDGIYVFYFSVVSFDIHVHSSGFAITQCRGACRAETTCFKWSFLDLPVGNVKRHDTRAALDRTGNHSILLIDHSTPQLSDVCTV